MAVLGTTSSIGLERPTSDRKVQGSTPWSCTSKSEKFFFLFWKGPSPNWTPELDPSITINVPWL